MPEYKFSQQTYEMVAEVLARYQHGVRPEILIAAFANCFEEDSDRFDRDKFYKAVYGRKA